MHPERRAWLDAYVASMGSSDELTRREFMKLLGASVALAGLDGCTRMPPERVLPYVNAPELTPGVAQHYATSMMLDGYATGLIVESHEGRPTKIDGNPDHPASLGAAGVLEQASLLQLYSPHRAKHVRHGRARATWQEFADAFSPATLRVHVGTGGERLRILLEPTSSPTDVALLRGLAGNYPAAGVHVHSVARVFGGEPATVPQYDLHAADIILSVDSDFLARGPFHLRYARTVAERRRPEGTPLGPMNRLYALEPSPTVTGLAADHRLAVRPSEIETALAELLGALNGSSGNRGVPTSDQRAAFIAAVADDLRQHRGRSLVVAGDRLTPRARALVDAMNTSLGNVGRTIWFTPSPVFGAGDPARSLAALVDDMRAGSVDTLVCVGANPCYAAPNASEFAELMRRVPRTVYVGLFENETASLCDWMIPAAHYLESWGDARAYDGTISMVQPLIEPLYGGKTTSEVLAALAGDARASAHDLVRASWAGTGGNEDGWREAVGRGFVAGSAFARGVTGSHPEPGARGAGDEGSAGRELQHSLARLPAPSGRDDSKTRLRDDSLEVVFSLDSRVHDGSFADNGWLQELPDPVTTLTWGNAAWVSAATAARLGIGSGDHVNVRVGAAVLELPALIVAGQSDDTLALHFGYGRDGDEALARRVGVNVYPLWSGDAAYARASVRRTIGHTTLALTQPHRSLEPHTPAHAMTLAEFQRARAKESRALTLYQPHASLPDGPAAQQWAMTIDLNTCIGCGACAVACQAENNVPVVGIDDVRKGRHMHWLRIDRYVTERPTATMEVVAQPMLCQHCEKAPCEYVCPVEATVHSPDGLNEMIYNRCVGTRFCSNNCPYKVRRFNWFDYNGALSETEKAARNPDVTVRERGVMEKCTFCVQRIREAEIAASVEGRALGHDEVRTACQQACPTNAIVFGSLTDSASAVHRDRNGARAYAALEELGTNPRVRYLARVRNPHPNLDART